MHTQSSCLGPCAWLPTALHLSYRLLARSDTALNRQTWTKSDTHLLTERTICQNANLPVLTVTGSLDETKKTWTMSVSTLSDHKYHRWYYLRIQKPNELSLSNCFDACKGCNAPGRCWLHNQSDKVHRRAGFIIQRQRSTHGHERASNSGKCSFIKSRNNLRLVPR